MKKRRFVSFFNPIVIYITLNLLLLILYNLNCYYFRLISIPLIDLIIILLSIFMIFLGMLNATLFFSIPLKKQFTKLHQTYIFNYKKNKLLLALEVIGIICSFIVLLYFIKYFGIPKNTGILVKAKLAYLSGAFSYPMILQIGILMLWPVSFAYFTLYKLFKSVNFLKHFAISSTFLLLNNIVLGSRGIIGFWLINIILIDIYIDKFVFNKSINKKKVFLFLIIILIILSFFIFISDIREGVTKISYGLQTLILYFLGPFPATSFIIKDYLHNKLGYTYGFFTFGGLTRYSIGLLHIRIPEYGYVPIYKNFDYGFNSYTYIAYLINDFGVPGLLIFSFLVGFLVEYFYYKLKYKFEIWRFVFFINLLSLTLLYERDIISKWVSWWLIFLVIPLVKMQTSLKSTIIGNKFDNKNNNKEGKNATNSNL